MLTGGYFQKWVRVMTDKQREQAWQEWLDAYMWDDYEFADSDGVLGWLGPVP